MKQFKFRKILLSFGLALTVSLTAETKTGDTYEQVIQEKGMPASKLEAGKTRLLRYPEGTIRLENGVVVSIDRTPAQVAAVPKASPPPPPEVKPAAPAHHEEAKVALTWQTDYAAALVQAKAENRQVFLFFTGSDWCGWCMRLNKEILSTPEFARYAQEKLILVEIDFPRGKELPQEVKTQNAKLAKRYDIAGYPTVIILSSSGKKIGRLGYQEGGPNPFVATLSSL